MSVPALVLDSWALLAWLRNEVPAAKVEVLFQSAEIGQIRLMMSWINAGEVYYITTRRDGLKPAEQVLRSLRALPVAILLPSEQDIVAAASLKASRRLSYADAFAVALAMKESALVVTGDPEIAALSDLVEVAWLGQEPNPALQPNL